MLPGIRGVRLQVLRVEAKFKFVDKPVEHRACVNDRLDARNHALDRGAAAQQRRRLGRIGKWKSHQGRF